MKFQKIFVTGADGFIGSHLVERLVAQGYAVKALAAYNSFNSHGWLDTLPRTVQDGLEVVSGDLRDSDSVRSAMKGADGCLHLGALIAIPYSYQAPEAYVDTNVRGTINVLRAAGDLGLKRIVHTSTSEVYGTAQRVPIDETHPLNGQSPYSASKIAADQMAYAYYCSFGMPVVTIRPFNTFGPRQSARAVIPTIITQLAKGAGVRLGALDPTRDFTYVTDTVDGLIAGLNAPDEALGQVINLGTGFDISVRDTAHLIAEVMDKSIDIVEDSDRLRPQKSEVERLLSDNGKAKTLLNWTPKLAGREGLREGLARSAAWFLDPANLARYRTDIYNV
jgi:dTDP-glucose 4,6-dehydratase